MKRTWLTFWIQWNQFITLRCALFALLLATLIVCPTWGLKSWKFSLAERIGAVKRERLCLKHIKDSVKQPVASAVSMDQCYDQYRSDTLQLVDLPSLKESGARTNHLHHANQRAFQRKDDQSSALCVKPQSRKNPSKTTIRASMRAANTDNNSFKLIQQKQKAIFKMKKYLIHWVNPTLLHFLFIAVTIML